MQLVHIPEKNKLEVRQTRCDVGLTVIDVCVDGLAETQAQSVQFWAQDFDGNVASSSTAMKMENS